MQGRDDIDILRPTINVSIMKGRIHTANIQCVEADYVGSDTSDTPSVNLGSAAGASGEAESDSDKEDHREACRLMQRNVRPLTEYVVRTLHL